MTAALNSGALTKTQLMGWFALQSKEADALPRARHARRAGGSYFLYRQPAFEFVLGECLPSIGHWEARVRARALPRRPDVRRQRLPPRKRAMLLAPSRRVASCR